MKSLHSLPVKILTLLASKAFENQTLEKKIRSKRLKNKNLLWKKNATGIIWKKNKNLKFCALFTLHTNNIDTWCKRDCTIAARTRRNFSMVWKIVKIPRSVRPIKLNSLVTK
jgi:hypothetical protein